MHRHDCQPFDCLLDELRLSSLSITNLFTILYAKSSMKCSIRACEFFPTTDYYIGQAFA